MELVEYRENDEREMVLEDQEVEWNGILLRGLY